MKRPLILFSMLGICFIFSIGVMRDFPGLIRHFQNQPNPVVFTGTPTRVATIDSVWVMIGQVNQPRILTDIRKLSGLEPICLDQGCFTILNRMTGSEGLKWAEDYLVSQLTSLGYAVNVQDWIMNGYTDRNYFVRIPGKTTPGKEIYFVAHLDGESCPAADDNGSGAASLLELARILRYREFDKTIVLLFTTGEEQSTLGAKSYINQLTPEQIAAIQYVINVDMVGYDSNKDGNMELFNGTQPLDLVQLLSGIITGYQLNLNPEIFSDCG